MDGTTTLSSGQPTLKLRLCHIHLHPIPQSTLHRVMGKGQQALLLASYVTLDKLPNLSEAFLPQQIWMITITPF